MAKPSEKLANGIQQVCDLHARPTHNETVVDQAWAALRMGVVVARKDEEALDSYGAQEMGCTLEFLVHRAMKKKAARGQVKECLRVLLARRPWLTAARADEALQAGLQEALEGEADADLRQQLASPAPGVEEEARASPPSTESEGEQPGKAPSIRQRVAASHDVMRSFGWQFPNDPLGTKLDQATDGFQNLFDGITALTTSSGRASVGGDPRAALADLEGDWQNVLQFLLSMYNSGVRTTYTSRIRFVVVNLRSFSPAFRELLPWKSLPWGSLPMPAEEAEQERRQSVEAEDLRLARELQAQEEAEVQAMEEERQRLVEEDSALALMLQSAAAASAARQAERAPRQTRGIRRVSSALSG